MGQTVSLAELSLIVGRSERVLIEYTDAGMSCLERGGDGKPSTYDTAQVVSWMIGQATARRDSTTEIERRRLLAAQANRAELELALRRGELVSAEEFRKGAHAAARALNESLFAMPARVAQALDPADPQRAQDLLVRELQQVMADTRRYLETLPLAPVAARRQLADALSPQTAPA